MEEYEFVHVATVDVNRLDEALARLAKKKIETRVKEQPGSARPGVGSLISSRRLILVPEAELMNARKALGIGVKGGLNVKTKAVFLIAAILAIAGIYYLFFSEVMPDFARP